MFWGQWRAWCAWWTWGRKPRGLTVNGRKVMVIMQAWEGGARLRAAGASPAHPGGATSPGSWRWSSSPGTEGETHQAGAGPACRLFSQQFEQPEQFKERTEVTVNKCGSDGMRCRLSRRLHTEVGRCGRKTPRQGVGRVPRPQPASASTVSPPGLPRTGLLPQGGLCQGQGRGPQGLGASLSQWPRPQPLQQSGGAAEPQIRPLLG